MTPRRVVFERVRKTLGWLAVPLALAAIALGLVLVDAPRWMAFVVALWWMALAAMAVSPAKAWRRG